MKIGILGTGMVGRTIGTFLISKGHQVMMGSRTRDNENATSWVASNGENASTGTFADSANFGELLFNCTAGMVSLEALRLAGADNMKGKILIDVSNPLDFSRGMPPTLTVCNEDSLGEQIQREFPDTRVVKTLNTMNMNLMVNPSSLPGEHDIFVCGNDEKAKSEVIRLLKDEFGWKSVINLGEIHAARGTEMLMPLWARLYGNFNHTNFNYKIVTQ